MRGNIFLSILGSTAVVMSPAAAAATSQSSLKLSINPTLCVVDVVQDGTNQLLQTPSAQCQSTLPYLLPANGATTTTPNIPFILTSAGSNGLGQPLLSSPPENSIAPWSSVVSKEETVRTNASPGFSTVAGGVSLTALTTAIGLDMALFEMRYLKTVANWARVRSPARLFMKQ